MSLTNIKDQHSLNRSVTITSNISNLENMQTTSNNDSIISNLPFLSTTSTTIPDNKHNLKSFLTKMLEKRRYITRSIWVLSIITLIICSLILTAKQFVIVLTSIISLSVLINILFTYIHPDFFTLDAYFIVTILYILAFAKFILIPTDIAINNYTNKKDNYYSTLYSLNIAWKVISYTSIALGVIFLKLQIRYWSQGYPTVLKKISAVLKTLFKQILILIIVLIIIVLIFILRVGLKNLKNFNYKDIMDGFFGVINVLNLLYTLIFFIVLLGFGLVELPLYLFRYTSSKENSRICLNKLQQQYKECKDALNVYLLDFKILKDTCLLVNKKFEDNKVEIIEKQNLSNEFAKDILKEISNFKLEENKLFNKDLQGIKASLKMPNKDKINNDFLALAFSTVKYDLFLAIKKQALFIKTYNYLIKQLIPCNPFEVVDVKKEEKDELNSSKVNVFSSKISISKGENDDIINTKPSYIYRTKSKLNKNKEYCYIVPKKYKLLIIIFSKLIGIIFALISLLILAVQASLVLKNKGNIISMIMPVFKDSFVLTYFFFIFYIIYLFTSCYFALTQFKLTDGYLIVKHHTNREGMAYNAKLCDTLIFGIIYNIVVILGPIYFKSDTLDINKSSMEKFFNIMSNTGILFEAYNYYFPIFLYTIILLYICKKFRLLCFKNNETSDKYFESYNNSNIEEDNLQKIYSLMVIIEDIYQPLEQNNSIGTINKQSLEIEEHNKRVLDINKKNEVEISKTMSKLKEIALLQKYLMIALEENDLISKTEKKYFKLYKNKVMITNKRQNNDFLSDEQIYFNKDIKKIYIKNSKLLICYNSKNNLILHIESRCFDVKDSNKELNEIKEIIEYNSLNV